VCLCYCLHSAADRNGIDARTDKESEEKSFGCIHSNINGSNRALYEVSYCTCVLISISFFGARDAFNNPEIFRNWLQNKSK
jgi:hypothetical protein